MNNSNVNLFREGGGEKVLFFTNLVMVCNVNGNGNIIFFGGR
jgi:hypothetical protein